MVEMKARRESRGSDKEEGNKKVGVGEVAGLTTRGWNTKHKLNDGMRERKVIN